MQISLDSSQVAEFTIKDGVGYSPITFKGLYDYRGWKLYQMVSGRWFEIDQSVFGKDFWQTNKMADDLFSITYNILLDTSAGQQCFRLTKGDMEDK